MIYQIVIENSFEITPGKYVLMTSASPILPFQENLVFPIFATYQIGKVEYEGQIVLTHFCFNELVSGFWSFQREYLLFAMPRKSFAGQIIDAIAIMD
ncbi:TPA: hypothetical protein ACGOZ1_001301 [Streptococcus suis]